MVTVEVGSSPFSKYSITPHQIVNYKTDTGFHFRLDLKKFPRRRELFRLRSPISASALAVYRIIGYICPSCLRREWQRPPRPRRISAGLGRHFCHDRLALPGPRPASGVIRCPRREYQTRLDPLFLDESAKPGLTWDHARRYTQVVWRPRPWSLSACSG